MRRFIFSVPFIAVVSTSAVVVPAYAQSPDAMPSGSSIPEKLTLAVAEQRALASNRRLLASAAAVEAAEAEATQAGLLPNPELAYSRENLGNDRLAGLDGPSASWLLSQRFSLGGQRTARRDAARGEAGMARAGWQGERDFLRADVRSAWVDVLAAQQGLAFAETLEQVGISTRQAVTVQVRAGKVSPVELTRTDVAMSALQRRVQSARQSLAGARQRLALLQGLPVPDFGILPDALPARSPLPPQHELAAAEKNSAAVKVAAAKTRAREAGLASAKAERFPEVTLSLGQTRFEDAGESAWQMGVSLPLPLFDRRQGAVKAAQARLREARAQADAAAQDWQAEIDVLYPQLRMLEQQLADFEKSVLPASEDAFTAVSKGYRFGKFGLLDVLDAQRALIDTRFDYLDTVTEYHRQRNRLDALLGLGSGQDNALLQENPL